jgi:predicted aspartyl protease
MGALLPLDTFSRRRFVGYGAASFALSPIIARAQGTSLLQGLPPPRPSEQPDASKITAATDAAQHLTIGVQINGKGPFRFVVDTGADRSVIAEDVATSLSLPRGTGVMVEGVIRTVPADTVKIAQLMVGPVARQNLSVPVLPRSQLRADGYLGLDIIDGYRVTLDFKNNELLLSEPLHLPRHLMLLGGWILPDEVMVPVNGRFGHLRAFDCGIDGIRAVAFVDTGAEISVGNWRLFNALAAKDPSYVRQDNIPLTGVTGGVVTGRVTTLNHVRMNALTFENGSVAIVNLQIFDLWELSDKPALLIGMNWLRRFSRVTIDYGRKELRFNLSNRAITLNA